MPASIALALADARVAEVGANFIVRFAGKDFEALRGAAFAAFEGAVLIAGTGNSGLDFSGARVNLAVLTGGFFNTDLAVARALVF